jgi:hypothetical protein
MPTTPTQALYELQTQPQAFLERFTVRIFGFPTNSQVAKYRIEAGGVSQRPGSILGTLNMHATQLFEIRAIGAAFGNPPGSVWFDAHSVKMFDSINLAALGTYTLPTVGGPDVMVTGQLSGCAFAIHDNGNGSLVVAHIRPSVNINALTLQHTLQNIPYWTVVYGRDNYAGQRVASIVGCRAGGQWHVWAQKQDDTSYDVRSVKKLI